MDLFLQGSKPNPPPPYEKNISIAGDRAQPSVQKSEYAFSLWKNAAMRSKKKLPQELADAAPSDILSNVCDETKARQDESEKKQWKFKKPGKSDEEVKLREVYEIIASCATRFLDVSDLVVQAAPVHTALP